MDVSLGFLTDLALRAVSLDSDCTTATVSSRLRLGLVITETLLQRLQRDKFIETKGLVSLHNHRYGMLERGWAELNRLNNVCSYAGPAPVSLQAYTERIVQQVRSRQPVKPQALEQAMAGLVLEDEAKLVLGLVASSGRSLFLNGPSGNGKTASARALVDAIVGDVWIPYAIEVDGQVIRIYDAHNHQVVPHANDDYDRRWVRIKPPLVTVGGELTIQTLDLASADTQRFYEAPLQVRSNGGVLVVDDLGRQRCSARELLNRWIIPLEYRVDYLTLSTGKKIQVPFEQTVVFATNLTEADLTDEAFLRRMGYRLYVGTPTPEKYREIFGRYARSRGLSVEPRVITQLLDRYVTEKRLPKCCDPRDLVDRAIDICKYRGQTFNLTSDILSSAWDSYFGAGVAKPTKS